MTRVQLPSLTRSALVLALLPLTAACDAMWDEGGGPAAPADRVRASLAPEGRIWPNIMLYEEPALGGNQSVNRQPTSQRRVRLHVDVPFTKNRTNEPDTASWRRLRRLLQDPDSFPRARELLTGQAIQSAKRLTRDLPLRTRTGNDGYWPRISFYDHFAGSYRELVVRIDWDFDFSGVSDADWTSLKDNLRVACTRGRDRRQAMAAVRAQLIAALGQVPESDPRRRAINRFRHCN